LTIARYSLIITPLKRNNANLIGGLKMATYKATVTIYSDSDDRVSTGLTLEQSLLKVQRNIYGYDHDENHVTDSIIAFALSERGVTFFCADDTAQVNIKMEA